MWIVSMAAELLLLVWIIYSWKKAGKIKAKWKKESLVFRVLLPAGKAISDHVPISEKRMQKRRIYSILCQLTSEKEGREQYYFYRWKRCGLAVGILLLCNTVWMGMHITEKQKGETFNSIQERPIYGSGSQKEEVTLVLERADGAAEHTFSLSIPEKAITEEAAVKRLEEGLAYVMYEWQGRSVLADISLPARWKEVSLVYESLTPELLKENGRWVGTLAKQRQSILLRITGSIAGQSRSTEVQMWAPALAEISPEERVKMIAEKAQAGDYTEEGVVRLPTETELGESLYWTKRKPSSYAYLGCLSLLSLFVFWQQEREYKQKIKDRQYQIEQAYPEFINELVILLGAGLSFSATWKRLGEDYQKQRAEGKEENPLYEEIYQESRQLQAGASMREVLEEFIANIRSKQARRFAVLAIQNLKRGDAFLISRLKELNQEAWELRKKQVRERSEEVDTKLLFPLMLMLIVILMIVLTPAMISMQV